MQNSKNMPDAMEELAKSLAIFFRTLLANDIPVDVAAHLTERIIEKVLLNSGQQHGSEGAGQNDAK